MKSALNQPLLRLNIIPKTMMIRNAEARDLPVILEIMNEAILNTTSIYDYVERDRVYVDAWFEKKRIDKLPVIVLEAKGETVGYGSYGIFRPWEGFKFSVEHSIYVHKDHQGKGYGKQLLIALIERAKLEGYHVIIAGIDAENQKSCEFHEKLGFTETGRLKEVGYKFGRWLDLVFMQLTLKNPS